MSVQFQEFIPDEALQPYVAGFWRADFNPLASQTLRFKVVPRGVVELVLHLSDFHCDLEINSEWSQSPDYTVIGLRTEAYEVRFREKVQVLGIRFKPDGFYALFGLPAAEFSHCSLDMEDVLGLAFREYSEQLHEAATVEKQLQLTEHFLLTMLRKNNSALPYLHSAAELIRAEAGEISVDELSRKVFISPRQLERDFKKITGVAPTLFLEKQEEFI